MSSKVRQGEESFGTRANHLVSLDADENVFYEVERDGPFNEESARNIAELCTNTIPDDFQIYDELY